MRSSISHGGIVKDKSFIMASLIIGALTIGTHRLSDRLWPKSTPHEESQGSRGRPRGVTSETCIPAAATTPGIDEEVKSPAKRSWFAFLIDGKVQDVCAGVLEIPFKNATSKTLFDNPTSDTDSITYRVVQYEKDVDLIIVDSSGWEWGEKHGFHLPTGTLVELFYNHSEVSPDRRYLLSYGLDLESGFTNNGLGIWAIDHAGMKQVFLIKPEDWGPADVRWVGSDRVRFSRQVLRLSDDGLSEDNAGDFRKVGTSEIRLDSGTWSVSHH